MLKLHEANLSYCILFEFHDDVAVIDSPEMPTNIKFFQVKTKTTGHWNIGDLIRSEGGLCHMGSMLHNYFQFRSFATEVTFVSNEEFNVHQDKMLSASRTRQFRISDLNGETQQKVKDHLAGELGRDISQDELAVLYFRTTSLSVHDHETHLLGRVSRFLNAMGAQHVVASAFFLGIQAEVRRRNNIEWSTLQSANLLATKGLSNQQVDGFIQQAASSFRLDHIRKELSCQLLVEGMAVFQRRNLINGITEYLARRCLPGDALLEEAESAVLQEVRGLPQTIVESSTPITMAVIHVSGSSEAAIQTAIEIYSVDFVHGMIAVLTYEHTVPSPNSPTAEAQT